MYEVSGTTRKCRNLPPARPTHAQLWYIMSNPGQAAKRSTNRMTSVHSSAAMGWVGMAERLGEDEDEGKGMDLRVL